VSIDLEHDRADLPRKIEMPMLVLWGEKSHVNRSYKPMEAWQARAPMCTERCCRAGTIPRSRCPTRRTRS
jgi:haloacetate dehalogenase